jgi:hypothetical protein
MYKDWIVFSSVLLLALFWAAAALGQKVYPWPIEINNIPATPDAMGPHRSVFCTVTASYFPLQATVFAGNKHWHSYRHGIEQITELHMAGALVLMCTKSSSLTHLHLLSLER